MRTSREDRGRSGKHESNRRGSQPPNKDRKELAWCDNSDSAKPMREMSPVAGNDVGGACFRCAFKELVVVRILGDRERLLRGHLLTDLFEVAEKAGHEFRRELKFCPGEHLSVLIENGIREADGKEPCGCGGDEHGGNALATECC